MQNIKAAVIGVGYLGIHHARIYSSLDGVELVGCVDTDDSRSAVIKERFGCDTYHTIEDLPKDVDVVSIVTPTVTHHEVAMKCLRAGKDILLEKPITTSVEEAEDIISEAQKLGRIVQIGHLERYNPVVVEVLKMIDSPLFIESERVAPFQLRGTDVDVTLDLMIHDIDIVMSLLKGVALNELHVVGTKVMTDKVDLAKAWLEFENGTKALITASRVATVKNRMLKVHQGSEYIQADYQNMTIMRYRKQDGNIVPEKHEIQVKEPLKEEIEDFIQCIRERGTPKVSAEDGKRALEIALDITRKIQEQIR